ncbi:MAG: R2-like ligand-binding oxidase [Anaerolineaceae bacterium]|nr:MAG: R2-like ligand-binding oxidase [Anaerolineaceae bacterium]
MNKRTSFATTTRGLRRDTPPMKLFEKAKKYGIWNPSDIDLTQDRADWLGLNDDEQDIILRLIALFQAGEEAVTLDLLPLIMTIASEGRIEEEMFLTTFLWEEAKHTDFFSRLLTEVIGDPGDLTRYHKQNYRTVFYEALPTALDRLRVDSSAEAQVVASVTYNMIVEGVLAETGYYSFYTALRDNGLMPGATYGIDRLKQDESRHIAYGIYLISRLVAENPALWDVAEQTMNTLLMPALGVVTEAFEPYNPVPFGLSIDAFTSYAIMQFQKRFERIQQSKGAALDHVEAMTHAAIEADDA